MAQGDFLTWAVQAQDAPAHVARILQTILLNEGVVDVAGGSLQVQEDTGSNMNIKIGSGTLGDLAVVEGDDASGQGVYAIEAQNATVTKTIAASDPSDDRIDLVVLQNYDDEADSSGNNDAEVEVIEGTPAGSPSAPSLPDSAIPLAEVLVGAGVSAITNANITDKRVEPIVRGQFVETVVFTSSGSFVKANYPWLRKVRVRGQGPGGGGGHSSGTNERIGAGGSGGGYFEKTIDASDLGSSVTVTVGTGGAGGTAGGSGANGSAATSFGSHATAGAGLGGGAGDSTTVNGPTGASATSGDVNVQGGDGYSGGTIAVATLGVANRPGFGGSSQMGRGGTRNASSQADGRPGRGYGSGGAGGSRNNANADGGAGANGILIVDLFA